MLSRCCKGAAAIGTAVAIMLGLGDGKFMCTAAAYAYGASVKKSDFVGFILDKETLYLLIPLITLFLLVTGMNTYQYLPKLVLGIKSVFKSLLLKFGFNKGTGNDELDKIIEAAGYRYDSEQDIFYSHMNAWQRNFGYCRLYDEACAPLGMIVDSEPFCFDYEGRKWLIEIWKGQYDMTTGCEIGIYNTSGPNLNIPGGFNGTFYHCVDNSERLDMSCVLKKDGKPLFTRNEKHWWLTGFVLGEFSEPEQLTMEVTITLKDRIMCNVFVNELIKAGYSSKEIKIDNNTVSFEFDKPHLPQPVTRTEETDRIIQKKNKLLCDLYKDITKSSVDLIDKINKVKEQNPEIYNKIRDMGKCRKVFEAFNSIKEFLK